MRQLMLLLTLLTFCGVIYAQQPSSGTDRMKAHDAINNQYSPISKYKFENIGPTIFSGRISDVAVDPEDPTHFYAAYASGGLWETKNNGTTFEPIFDQEAVMTIGAIAVNWKTGKIWVGTGEVNSSRSSYAGLGVYTSEDNGATWQHKGLEESHHIGRIILHPTNNDIAWVAVLGHLYSYNSERGVYMTSDGGNSWKQALAVDEKTGAVDLIIDPTDSNTLYAAMWQRLRQAWNFEESGPGSGIYKSTNGGMTWSKMSKTNSGFPDGDGTGRIGLSVSKSGSTTRIYALLDNYNRRPAEAKESEGLVKADFKSMSKADFSKLTEEHLNTYLKDNRFPKKYSAKSIKKKVASDELQPSDLATFLENANALLFDTPVIGAELYYSDNGGTSWQKSHEGNLDGLYYSYGYYFGTIRSNPNDINQVYLAGVPIVRSNDGGKTFENVNGQNVHSDHHSIWINPDNPNHVINGNDGGINISYDSGDNWIKCNSPSVGQFYYINADNAKPYNVYGGTQDNGVWKGSSRYRSGVRWHNTGKYPYQSLLGGDGMQVQIDPRDNNTVYAGSQFGNYARVNATTGKRNRITPQHELGERPYRWNWQAPIHLSIHQPDIFYMGAEKLFRSFDKGVNFDAISDDLTKGGKEGDVPFGTLATIHESPMKFGLIYTGSDDGLIYVTKDGGHSWNEITAGLPKDLWVSRVQASAHKEGRVYASLNGYRNDNFGAYAYVSEDYGKIWTSISSSLPQEPINVIKEDPHHEEIIYVGTDRGVYVSIDRGQSYISGFQDIPSVPVHDIVVQAEAKDLLIGTHGRSIYKGSLEPLYAMKDMISEELTLLDINDINYNNNLGKRRNAFSKYATGEQELIVYSAVEGTGNLYIKTEDKSTTVAKRDVKLSKGLNYITYDLTVDSKSVSNYKKSLDDSSDVKESDDGKFYLLPSKYTVEVSMQNKTSSTILNIKKR